MKQLLAAVLLAALTVPVAAAHRIPATREVTASSVNAAAPPGAHDSNPALVIKAEILLDRRNFSPGEIDGKKGDNFRRALQAFQETNGLPASGEIDSRTWDAVTANVTEPVLRTYVISKADVSGPFEKRVPQRLTQMAKLRGLSYKGPLQELSEKFHMSEGLLRRLNPGADFDRAGTRIVVAAVRPMDLRPGRYTIEAVPPSKPETSNRDVATIVVDKPARDVRAYDRAGKLLAFYPATIGSSARPAPTGTFKVKRVAWNPDYHYDPKFAWKGVKTKRALTIRPGPNNPVGLVWIDLTAASYGIHGTPAPQNIGKTESHGCIRLTNWDAVQLAAMVHPGTVVKFDDKDTPVVPLAD
jgi:lipoprotein-anchoring transpeptidase ErfK/SrfK